MNEFVEISKELLPSLPDSFFDEINRPINTGHDSFYIFTLHKCASTMLQRTFRVICEYNNISNISIDGWRFRNNYKYSPENMEELCKMFLPKGYWYGVFRNLCIELTDVSCFDFTRKSILVVRDPRDILVSHYYSRFFSHIAPGQTGKTMQETIGGNIPDIDSWVLQQSPSLVKRFNNYINDLLPHGNTLVFRYEDFILDKGKLFRPALDYLDLEFPDSELEKLIKNESIVPDREDKNKHIRQVKPGDHKNKLRETAIKEMNIVFDGVLDYFDYSKL